MRCVMVMFDSLNRHFLPSYGNTWVHAPNFRRLAERTVTFDRSYVCSMPCMPARRDLHTGRPGFLDRGWGPLEPWDESSIENLKRAGIHTHLASDHYHYWEDGGANYHCRYNTWEFFRGQEGDPWIGQVAEGSMPKNLNSPDAKGKPQDVKNRAFLRHESDHYQTKTFRAGVDYIDRNAASDDWFLQIETFDPHEPFFTYRKYRDLYPSPDSDPDRNPDDPIFDWPPYGQVTQSPGEVAQARRNYAALVSQCDANLGLILDAFDRYRLWDDTMLVVWTDHGYLLGEHGWWAKNKPPMYEEVSHTPFFVWDPRCGKRGERRSTLVQPSIDLGPTLLSFFEQPPLKFATGHDLRETVASDKPVRDAAIFGYNNSRVNLIDGRYAYYRDVVNPSADAFDYTIMPALLWDRYPTDRLAGATLGEGSPRTLDCPPLKIPLSAKDTYGHVPDGNPRHLLFDIEADPAQEDALNDPDTETRLCRRMADLMAEVDAPAEQFDRMGLERTTRTADRR